MDEPVRCPFCKRPVPVPPHGDREDAMLAHLGDCGGG